MGKRSLPPRLTKIVKAAKAAGWDLDYTADGHPRLLPPRGTRDSQTGLLMGPVTFASTPSDHRGDRNAIGLLRRSGVDIPRK